MPYKDPKKRREAQAAYARKVQKEANDRRRKIRREIVDGYKSERGCMYCGEVDPVALDLHHRDPSTKKASISRLVVNMVKVDVIQLEMEKCDVICSNCHRKLHAGRELHRV